MAKILVIDDDVPFNESLKQYLEYVGHSVVCAFDGKQGLSLLVQVKPDLVITDIVMPSVDGLEFIMGVRDRITIFPCRVIAMSGGGRIGGANYLEMATALGVDDALEKPFGMEALEKSIETLLA